MAGGTEEWTDLSGAMKEGSMAPTQFVMIKEDQSLEIQPEALDFLRSLEQPIYVLSLAGVAREGKSTWLTLFMRHLAEKSGSPQSNVHFKVSKGVQTCTSGCWVWASNQLPGKKGTLLLMDTQGLASGNQEGLNRLFTFSVLLSSVMVLNVMRQVNDDTLDKLGAVAALSRLVQGDVSVFPKLYALVRDFELSVEESGFSSLDEYLEDLLTKDGNDERDATRASIKSIFKNRSLLAMETPTKADKAFLNSWNQEDGGEVGMPPDGDFLSSFVKAADAIYEAATANPKKFGSVALGGDEMADLAADIVEKINEKPVDLHSALHSIFDGVCRRAMMAARDQVVDELHNMSDELPMQSDQMQEKFTGIKDAAHADFSKRCESAGVPEDDSTWKEHSAELDRMLDDKKQIIQQDNEKKIMELIAAVTHKYEDTLREEVDALMDDDEMLTADLALYIEKHEAVVERMSLEYAKEISIASEDQLKTYLEKFQKTAKDLRSRNLERVRLKQAAEAEKKQKMMMALCAVTVILAVGIDGDPFDELLSVLRLLWFLPILCMGGAGYFFLYGSPPPYTMQIASTAMTTANDIIKHIKVNPEEAAKKKKKDD